MSNTEIKSRFHIIHLEVTHGSDRYEIHLHMERPPLVRDLMEEIEKKARVTTDNQRLMFRGQRLQQHPEAPLEKFGLFNGNRIMLIGDKLTGQEDDHFRRLLAIEKDVNLIDDVLELVCRDFENIKQSGQTPDRCLVILEDLKGRGERCRTDLLTFQSITNNLTIDSGEHEARRKQQEVAVQVRDRLDIASNIISAVSSYQNSGRD